MSLRDRGGRGACSSSTQPSCCQLNEDGADLNELLKHYPDAGEEVVPLLSFLFRIPCRGCIQACVFLLLLKSLLEAALPSHPFPDPFLPPFAIRGVF